MRGEGRGGEVIWKELSRRKGSRRRGREEVERGVESIISHLLLTCSGPFEQP